MKVKVKVKVKGLQIQAFFVSIGIAILFCSFVSTLTAQELSPNKTRIGVLLPLSGEDAHFGEILREGILKGATSNLELIFEDTACQPAKGVTAVNKLVEVDKVKFFLGPCCSSVMNAVAPQFAKKGLLSMAICTTSNLIYQISKGNVFIPHISIEREAAFLSKEMEKKGIKRVVMVFLDNELSRGHEKALHESFSGTIVDTLAFPSFDSSHVKAAVLKMRSLDFDAVYVPLFEPFLLGLMKEMNKIGIRDKKVFGIYAAQMAKVLEVEGESANGLYYSYPNIDETSDAIKFFPELGTRILEEVVKRCKADLSHCKDLLHSKYQFDKDGTIEYPMVLKTVKNGKFVIDNSAMHSSEN